MITSVGGMQFEGADVAKMQAKLKHKLQSGLMGKSYHSPLTLARMHAAKGRREALAGIARIAREGDQMMMIENGGGAIPKIAAQRFELYV